jgi:membrane-bound lytic murein transglycosylase B
MLAAYRQAAVRINIERPGCQLSWSVLAGIGRIESGHAAGRRISADGTVTPTILGPRLDGSPGIALIRDTDHGMLDHDTEFDRAVGPMQFIPSTWRWAGRDADGDGTASPDNIDDATLAAAGYLCRSGDLSVPARLTAAIHRYNPSDAYVRAVLAWAAGYADAEGEPETATSLREVTT